MQSRRNDSENRFPIRLFDPQSDGQPAASLDGGGEARKSREERELDRISGVADARSVTITLGQMVPLVTDAAEKNRLWLTDFADEKVRIDADLYEVLLAYQRMSRRDAA
ncbi:MAG: hypothetical protein AAF958_10725 [Planctomycetota bacterium]